MAGKVRLVPLSSEPDPALAAALKQLRNARGTTQEDLAHDAKVAVSTLQAIENARSEPGWQTVRRLVAALGVNMQELGTAIDVQER
jgi:transcriptional regulator with XRE-family HTH domain